MSIFMPRRRLYLVGIDFLIVLCTYLAIIALTVFLGAYRLTLIGYTLDFAFTVAVIFI